MRRIAIGLLAGVAFAGTAGAATGPRLEVVTRTPLVVAGTHFHAGERVKLLVAGSTFVVRTTRLGTFRARLATPLADRCSAVQVTALGSRESARVRLPVRTMCAPASPARPGGAPAVPTGAAP
jgi:hypothetical protein